MGRIANAYRGLRRAVAAVIPGSYAGTLDPGVDGSLLAISAAPAWAIPPVPGRGDQGYQVNAWAVAASSADFTNPGYGNSDVARLIGVNPGGGAAQTNGLSVYMLNNAPGGSGQTTGIHVIGVSNNDNALWGYNAVLSDVPYVGQTYVGAGRYLDNEFDFNVSDPKTIMTGLSIGGTLLASPAYGAGFVVNFGGPGRITEAFYSWDGAAEVGLHLGLFAKPASPNAGGQAIKLDYVDGDGQRQYLTLTAFAGTLVLGGTRGAAFGTAAGGGITETITVGDVQLVVSGGLIVGTRRS